MDLGIKKPNDGLAFVGLISVEKISLLGFHGRVHRIRRSLKV